MKRRGGRGKLGDQWRLIHNVSVGPRYVFFNSLFDSHGQLSDIYRGLGNKGMEYVNAASAALHPNKDSNSEQLEKIRSYIQMIGELAENERENEITFINKFSSMLNQDTTGELSKCFESFTNLENGFDYFALIALINELLKNNDKLAQERKNIIRNNMELMETNFQNSSNEFQQKLSTAYRENYGKFSNLAYHNLIIPISQTMEDGEAKITQQYQTSIPSLLASKFNSIINNIINSPEYLQLIEEKWKSNQWKGSVKSFIQYTTASIMEYLKNLKYEDLKEKKGEELAIDVINNLDNIITIGMNTLSKEQVENFANIAGVRAQKSLEEVALTTHRNLANMFMQLTDAEQAAMIDRYSAYGFTEEKLNEISKDLTSELDKKVASAKRKISRLMITAIEAAAQKEFNINLKEIKKGKEEYKKFIFDLVRNDKKDFFKSRELKDTIQNNLSIKINGSSLAEFLVSDHFKQALGAIVFVPGSNILLKTDASFTLGFNEDFNFIDEETTEKLKKQLDNFEKNFLNKYKIGGKGITDVSAAHQAFLDTMGDIYKTIEAVFAKTDLSENDKKQLLEQLKNFIMGSISIKEYAMGTNELGFTGGSLGPNVYKVIDNITKMYDLGGVSAIDADLLIFAVINCSTAAIGAGLKDDLATYLLGGAAMMMFDEGFAMTTNFMSSMINQFGFAPSILHLYSVQGTYIPASYVYTTIYNNLLQVYPNIVSEVSSVTAGAISSNQVSIVNNISDEDIPSWDAKGFHHAQTRWDAVKETANSSVNISFTFLAGLLDIFRGIEAAFNL